MVDAGRSVTVKLDTAKLDAIVKDGLDKALQGVVEKAAFDVERMAKAEAPIDTGALANSIHTVLSWRPTGGYSKAIGNAGALRPGVEMHPEVWPEAKPGEVTAIVAAAVNYAEYQEYGTVHMAGHPFLRPALNRVKGSFKGAVAGVLEKLAR